MRAAIFRFRISENMTLRVSANPEKISVFEQPDTNPIVTIDGVWYQNHLTGKPALLDMTFDEAMAEHTNALNAPTLPVMQVADPKTAISSIMDLPEDE